MNLSKSIGFLIPTFLIAMAQAESDLCSDSRYATLNKQQCVTAASGAAVAAGSGIYAAKKFQSARLIEQDNTQKIFNPSRPGVTRAPEVRGTQQIMDGDKITIQYQLSAAENRAYHIELMLSNASSADSTASYHFTQSLTATRSVYETESDTDSEGKTTTRSVYKGEEPDYAARMMHASLATDYEQQARDYRAKAEDARRGGAVPTYDFDKVVDDKLGNRASTVAFLEERFQKESRIMGISRLPAKYHLMVKSATRKGAAGIAGVAAGFLFMGEELMSGIVAEKMKRGGLSLDIETQQFNELWNQ